MRWSINNISSLKNKIVIITGANSGLGFETSKVLSSKGAIVIMACRDTNKGEESRLKILKQFSNADLIIKKLDLADLSSIRSFAEDINNEFNHLDILYNNAGLMAIPESLTKDGFETQFGVNHLGHFALTALLIDLLLKTDNSRIVTISSLFHYLGKMRISDPMLDNGYNRWKAYAQSKLANLLFTFELQRKLSKVSTNTIAVAAHPGYATTHLQSRGSNLSNKKIRAKFVNFLNFLFGFSAEMGAKPQIRAGTDDNLVGGEYFGPGLLNYLFPNKPRKVLSTRRARNQKMAGKLWKLSEDLTQIKFDIPNH